jgi:hypothetical protein
VFWVQLDTTDRSITNRLQSDAEMALPRYIFRELAADRFIRSTRTQKRKWRTIQAPSFSASLIQMCFKLWRVWGDIWCRGGAIRIRRAEAQGISAQYIVHYEQYSRLTNKFDLVHLSKFTQPSWLESKFNRIRVNLNLRSRRLADRETQVLPVGLGLKNWKTIKSTGGNSRQWEGFVAIPRDRQETPQTTARGSGRSCLMKNLSTWLKSRLIFKFVGRGTPRDRTARKKKKEIAAFCEIPFFWSAVERRSSRISAAVCLFVSRAPHGVHYCDGISTPIDPRCCCCCFYFHLFLEGISMSNIWFSSSAGYLR